MRSWLRLSIAVLFLVLVPSAHADWTDLGGRLNTDDRELLGTSQDLASVAGVPWIAWTERPADTFLFQVRAARWTGTAWSETAPLNVDPGHDARSVSIAGVGGVPYATWTENSDVANGTNHVYVARWTGGAWQTVGGRVDVVAGIAPSIADVGGVPYVAYSEGQFATYALRLARFDGTGWITVGDPNTTPATGADDLTAVDGVPYVAWTMQDRDGRVAHVQRLDGSTWTQLGTSLSHAGATNSQLPQLATIDGAIAAVWLENGAGPTFTLRVGRWDGTAWADVGSPVATADYFEALKPSLLEIGGTPFVSWASGRVVQVWNYDGAGWLQLGRSLNRSDKPTGDPVLADVGGVPYVSDIERYTTGGEGNQSDHYSVFAARLVPAARLHFSSATFTTQEGKPATVTVQRAGSTSGTVSVRYETTDGTAHSTEYTPARGRLTFGPGESEHTINVATTDDGTPEDDKTFSISLSGATGDVAVDAPQTATVTIANNDLIDTTISRGPEGLVADSRVVFFFEAVPPADATFACAFDGAAPKPCTSPLTEVGLAEGAHTFEVRATSGAGNIDPSPAVRAFTVDTVRPVTSVATYGSQLPRGAWSGPVQVRALATDPDPGSGVTEVRCVVDPAVAPQTASELRDPCPVTVTAPGLHSVYAAAVDRAGNAGIPAVAQFKIVVPVDTEITSGPSGSTTSLPATFTFRAISGDTLECQLDAAPYAPCTSPYGFSVLAHGSHVFRVRATSVDGEVDATPASRAFTLGDRVVKGVCGGRFSFGQEIDPNPAHFNPDALEFGGARCAAVNEDCPAGSVCKMTTYLDQTDEDKDTAKDDDGSPWGAAASAAFVDTRNLSAAGSGYGFCRGHLGRRDKEGGTKQCPVTVTGSAVGPLRATGGCEVSREYFGSGFHKQGPDDAREYLCRATLTISPASPLAILTPGGKAAAVYVPGPGSVTLSGAGKATGRAARLVAAKKPGPAVLTTVTQKVTAAGFVSLPLKLSKTAARTLRRKHRVSFPAVVTFTPNGGKAVSSPQTVTLITPTKPVKVKKVKRTRANAFR